MQIVSIKPTRNSGTVVLVFDNGRILPFSVDNLVPSGIKKFTDISNDLLNQIYTKSFEHQLWEYSLRQLSMLSQPEKAIQQKLKMYVRKKIHLMVDPKICVDIPSIISSTINRLKTRNLINNTQYADNYVQKSVKKSKRQIFSELHKKGINSSDSVRALSGSDDSEKIIYFLKRKILSGNDLSFPKVRNKIIASLYRRGFSLSDIKNAIDDLCNKG